MRRALLSVAVGVVCSCVAAVAASVPEHPPAIDQKRAASGSAGERWADAEARLVTDIEKAELTGEPLRELTAIQALAYRYWERGEDRKAIELYSKALGVSKQLKDSREGQMAICLNNLGLLCRELGDYERALTMHSAALDAARNSGDASASLTADINFSLGLLSLGASHFRDAQSYFDNVAPYVQSARKGTLDEARLLDAYAKLYILTGNLLKARETADRSWSVADKVLPENSSARIDFLDTQASIRFGLTRFTNAEKSWLRAVDIAESNNLTGAPEMISVLSHLGELYICLHEPTNAQMYLERSVNLLKKSGGTPTVLATITAELALMYTRSGNLPRAKEEFDQALAILDAPGAGRPLNLATVLMYYGEYWRAENQWSDAYRQFKRAADLRQKFLGDHPLLAASYRVCANTCKRLKRKDEAREYEARAREISAKFAAVELTAANTVDVKTLRSEKSSAFLNGHH